jgi:DNA-binding response OmpR family regulator
LGADDYVTKPFSVKELLARASAFLRRRRQEEPQLIRFGDCELNRASRQLYRRGEEVPLTPKEFRLLECFVRQFGRALTRDQILTTVWGHDLLVNSRSVDRCVTTLRKKIEPNPDQPQHIQTVRDVGYRFTFTESAAETSD